MPSLFASLLLMASAALSSAETIDRIAVSIEQKVITESEIDLQIRVTAFLNGEQADFSRENKRRTADRLVEQTIIRREIETSKYGVEAGSAGKAYDEFKKARYANAEEYQKALSAYKITDADVRKAFEWQSTLLQFIEVRFRPGIQIPESDIREFYDQEYAAQAKAQAMEVAVFDEVRPMIENILINRRVDNVVDRWLSQARTQLRIRYRSEAFR